jgi:DNA-binding CsgD family transcriptional regulator
MKHRDYLDISESADRATFQSRLVAFANRLDFGIVSAALAVDRPGDKPIFVMIGNTPSGFVEASTNAADARRDPVMRRLRTATRPFSYSQSTYVEEDAGDLWEAQAPYGYGTGIAMAMHMPGGKHFLLGVDRHEPLPEDDMAMTRLLADLQLLAVFAQDTAVRVLLPTPTGAEDVPQLTPREREILMWTRDGKSAWEIGQILGLSENTVAFHLKHVLAKFNVGRKQLAVLRAMSLGII